jgi:hypothetical protein
MPRSIREPLESQPLIGLVLGASGLRLLTAISQTTKKKAVQAGRELVAPTLPKTLFIFFAKFRRNESAPLALPEWEGPI